MSSALGLRAFSTPPSRLSRRIDSGMHPTTTVDHHHHHHQYLLLDHSPSATPSTPMSDHLSRIANAQGFTPTTSIPIHQLEPQKIANWVENVNQHPKYNPFTPLPDEHSSNYDIDVEDPYQDWRSVAANFDGYARCGDWPRDKPDERRIARWVDDASQYTMQNPFIHLPGEGIPPSDASDYQVTQADVPVHAVYPQPGLDFASIVSNNGDHPLSYPERIPQTSGGPEIVESWVEMTNRHTLYNPFVPLPYETGEAQAICPDTLGHHAQDSAQIAGNGDTGSSEVVLPVGSRVRKSYEGYPSPPTTVYTQSQAS